MGYLMVLGDQGVLKGAHAPDGATAGTAVVGASVGERVGVSVGAGVSGDVGAGVSVGAGVGVGVGVSVGAGVPRQTQAQRWTESRREYSS
jgi:hypothetical protein